MKLLELHQKIIQNKHQPMPQEKIIVVIAGDTVIKNIVGATMSKCDTERHYVVKTFPGATTSVMEDFIKPITRKSPDKIPFTLVATTQIMLCQKLLMSQYKPDDPDKRRLLKYYGRYTCLSPVNQEGLFNLTKIKEVNFILDSYCQNTNLPLLKKSNINSEHLYGRCLHLNKQDSLSLQSNFIELTNNSNH